MSMQKTESLLAPYRILDLTDEKGLLCGKLLGDLGADVIKIEKPGGDDTRDIGPFYKDIVHPEKSLFWLFFNLNKRGITLDIKAADGQEIFKRLVKTADFVIESFEPGYMDSLGLGYSALEAINRRVILVSITPFGQTGPYAHYKGSDLVCWAMGGMAHLCGDPDRAPLQVSFPQSYANAGADAAAAALAAHWHREMTGEGQHVDVSIQACVTWPTMDAPATWELNKVNRTRGGSTYHTPRPTPPGPLTWRALWPCKDGNVCWFWGLAGGAAAGFAASTKRLVQWMDKEGMAGDLRDFDWSTQFDTSKMSQEECDHQQEILGKFFLSKTASELYEKAVERTILLAPVSTAKELLQSPQLAARHALENVEHPELGDTITFPGPWVKFSETPITVRRRAPLIGEHNEEIYEGELRMSKSDLAALKARRVI